MDTLDVTKSTNKYAVLCLYATFKVLFGRSNMLNLYEKLVLVVECRLIGN